MLNFFSNIWRNRLIKPLNLRYFLRKEIFKKNSGVSKIERVIWTSLEELFNFFWKNYAKSPSAVPGLPRYLLMGLKYIHFYEYIQFISQILHLYARISVQRQFRRHQSPIKIGKIAKRILIFYTLSKLAPNIEIHSNKRPLIFFKLASFDNWIIVKIGFFRVDHIILNSGPQFESFDCSSMPNRGICSLWSRSYNMPLKIPSKDSAACIEPSFSLIIKCNQMFCNWYSCWDAFISEYFYVVPNEKMNVFRGAHLAALLPR